MLDQYVYGQTNGESRRNRIRRRKIVKFIFFAVLFLLIFSFCASIFKSWNKKTPEIISPLAVIQNIINPSRLNAVVKNSLSGTRGSYAVVIKNLKTGEEYRLNDNRKFTSASLYKLWVMAVVFNRIESSKLDPEKIIEKDIEALNDKFDIATESAELTEGVFKMSVKNALNQMITISHNYAALALTQEVGISNIASFLKQHDLAASSIAGTPFTTASDTALFFEKLYTRQLAGENSTQQMLDMLKKQKINDRIPKYLSTDIAVAHKTGELDTVKHDAGIVFTKKGDYILVILSESNSAAGAAEREALLSKDIYNYFQKR